MLQEIPEVNTGEAINELLKLLGRVESLQLVGLDDLLQLCHQPLLDCRIAAATNTSTYRMTDADISNPIHLFNYLRHLLLGDELKLRSCCLCRVHNA